MNELIGTYIKNDFLELISRLCRVPGPTLNESERRVEIISFLDSVSSALPNNKRIFHHTDEAGNLIVSLGKGLWSDSVVFDAHIDVVGKGFSEPFSSDDGRLYGLGTGDNLAAVTLLCLLAKGLASKDIEFKRPLYLLFSVCEEGYGNLKGVRRFVDDRDNPPHLFLSFDLSYKEYSISGLGSRRFSVRAKGPGGHSWDDRARSSAIEKMIHFLMMLKARQKGLDERHSSPYSFNIGIISGGEGVNIIAGNAEVHFEFRSTSETLLEEAAHIVESEVERGNVSADGVILEMSVQGVRPAAKSVRPGVAEDILKKVWKDNSVSARRTIRSTNINYPLSRNWPSMCTGLCECAGYHTEDEYIVIDSVEKGWSLLSGLVSEFVL